jgi:hypothetical protein
VQSATALLAVCPFSFAIVSSVVGFAAFDELLGIIKVFLNWIDIL